MNENEKMRKCKKKYREWENEKMKMRKRNILNQVSIFLLVLWWLKDELSCDYQLDGHIWQSSRYT